MLDVHGVGRRRALRLGLSFYSSSLSGNFFQRRNENFLPSDRIYANALSAVHAHSLPFSPWQASDAKGTIRVLRALLAPGGQAHFVVAHPRTRFGVDMLVPLLEDCPEFEFTCEDVTDPRLLSGLEEAGFLAWLHVHVRWANECTEPQVVAPVIEEVSEAAVFLLG